MVSWECPIKPREASGLDPEAVHLAVRLSLAFPAIVIDDLGPIQGLRTGWHTSADHLQAVGGVVLSAAVLGVVVNLIPYLGVLITALLVLPVFSLALARCYLDLTDST